MSAFITFIMNCISYLVDNLAEYLARFDYPIFDIIKAILLILLTNLLYRAALYIFQRCHAYLTTELRRDIYGLGRDPWAAMPIVARRWWKKSSETILTNICMTLLVLACILAFGLIGCIFPLIFTYLPTYWGKLRAVAPFVWVHESDNEPPEPATPLTPTQAPPQKIPPGRKPEGAGYVQVKDRRKHKPEEAQEPKSDKPKGKQLRVETREALGIDVNIPSTSTYGLSSPQLYSASPTVLRNTRRCNKPAGECLLALNDNKALRALAKEREESIRKWKEQKISDTDITVLELETEIKSLNNRLQAEVFQREHEQDVAQEKLNTNEASLRVTREQQFKKMLKQARSDKENSERQLAKLERTMSELKEGKTASELRDQLQAQTEAVAQGRAELVAEQARSNSHREQKEKAEARLQNRESELSTEILDLQYQLRAVESRCASLEEQGVLALPTTPTANNKATYEELETMVKAVMNENEQLQSRVMAEVEELESQLQDEQEKSGTLENRLRKKQSSTNQQATKLAAQKQEIERLKRELKKEQSKAVAPDEIQELKEKLSTSERERKATNKKLNATKEMLREALDRAEKVEKKAKELQTLRPQALPPLGTQTTSEVRTSTTPPRGTAHGRARENEGVCKQFGNVTSEVSSILEECDDTNFENISVQEVTEHDANEVTDANTTPAVDRDTKNEEAAPGAVPTPEDQPEATRNPETPICSATNGPSSVPQIFQQIPDDFGEISFTEMMDDALQNRSDLGVPQIQAELNTPIEDPVVEQTISQQTRNLQSQEANLQPDQPIFQQPHSEQPRAQESHTSRFPTQVILPEDLQHQQAHPPIFNLGLQQPPQAQQAQPLTFNFDFQSGQSQQPQTQDSHVVRFQAPQFGTPPTPAQQEMLKDAEELERYNKKEEERQLKEMTDDLELAEQAQNKAEKTKEGQKTGTTKEVPKAGTTEEGQKFMAIMDRNRQRHDEEKRIEEEEAEEERQDRLKTEREKRQKRHAELEEAREKKAKESGQNEIAETSSSDAAEAQWKEERNLMVLRRVVEEEEKRQHQAAAQLLELQAGQTRADEIQPLTTQPTHAVTQEEETRPVSPTNTVTTGRRKVQGMVAQLRKEQRAEAMRQAGNQVDQGCRFEQFRARRAGGSWHRWEPYLPQKLIMNNWHGLIDSRESLKQTAREFQELAEEFEVGYVGDMSLFGSDNGEQATLRSDNAE